MPVLASSTIRARSRIRASAFLEPANASRTCRSSGVSATAVATGMIFIPPTNHDSRFSDSGLLADKHKQALSTLLGQDQPHVTKLSVGLWNDFHYHSVIT